MGLKIICMQYMQLHTKKQLGVNDAKNRNHSLG
jgi:hypothetical protein